MPLAIDKERGSTRYAGKVGGIHVLADMRGPGVLAQVGGELLGVKAERGGVPDQVTGAERVLVLEERVVHFPERALPGGRLRGFGRELRVRMDVVRRQGRPPLTPPTRTPRPV